MAIRYFSTHRNRTPIKNDDKENKEEEAW